jgi:hypothetical protein
MVEKLSPRGNIKVQGYGKLHLDVGLSSPCLYIVHSQPLDFPCVIKPRSHDALELIYAGSSGLELFK